MIIFPYNTSRSNVRKKFYSQLEAIATPYAWLLRNFNAPVDHKLPHSDFALQLRTVGPYSLKNNITPNANGSLLLHAASSINLRHASSYFRLRDSKRWTWRHLDIEPVQCSIIYLSLRITCVSSCDALSHLTLNFHQTIDP